MGAAAQPAEAVPTEKKNAEVRTLSDSRIPARQQTMELLAILVGFPGAVLLAVATSLLAMAATNFLGPEMWTTLACLWSAWFVTEVVLIAGSLQE